MIKRIIAGVVIVSLLVLAWPRTSAAQVIVEDPAAIANLIATVSHLLQLIGLHTKDLMALADLAAILDIAAQIMEISGEIEGVADMIEARADGWRSRMSTIPCTNRDRDSWLDDAAEWGRQASNEALFTARLLRRTVNLMARVIRLIASITALFGTTSGLQMMSALTSVTIVELQKLQAMTALAQQVLIGREIIEQVDRLARGCIKAARYSRWGTFTRY